MAVRIRSLVSSGPLLVPLVRGGTLRLSPGRVSGELDDVEVLDNAKVEKLRAMRLIDVEPVEEEKPRRAAKRTAEPDTEQEK
jgi:hypothetical protein